MKPFSGMEEYELLLYQIDIPDTDTAGVIKLEIPEVKKEDVRVSMDNGSLTTRGERNQEKKY